MHHHFWRSSKATPAVGDFENLSNEFGNISFGKSSIPAKHKSVCVNF